MIKIIYRILLCLIVLISSTAASKAKDIDVSSFAVLPVLHDGRIKPMESFARIYLSRFSGRMALGDLSASEWLALSLFDPAGAAQIPVFHINDVQLLDMLALEKKSSRLYALSELAEGLKNTASTMMMLLARAREGTEANSNELSSSQQSLIELHENVLLYGKITKSLSMALPLNIPPPSDIEIEQSFEEGATYLELATIEQQLTDRTRRIFERKGANPDHYNAEEKALAAIMFEYNLLRDTESQNHIFRIIPAEWDMPETAHARQWISPWQVITSAQGGPQSAALLRLWQDMAAAFRSDDQSAFDEAANNILKPSIFSEHVQVSPKKLSAEVFYRQIQPFLWAEYLYVLSLILLVTGFIHPQTKAIYYAGFGAALIAFAAHLTGLSLRTYILSRPPVGSLYETLLFVSAALMAMSLGLEYAKKSGYALVSGVFGTLAMIIIAPMIAPDGDHLETLVAVLNSNFWLATHVTCITIGYAVCILTACLAHIYLFQRIFGQRDDYRGLLSVTYKTALFALFFTAFGTMLGGVWADQSWGRFWGWDPKENGALLIVLWLIWLTHARIGDYFSNIDLAASIAFLNVIVAIAWFGVNLLSVGLHSYGFIDGVAWVLGLFCAFEIIVIGILWFWARVEKKEERTSKT